MAHALNVYYEKEHTGDPVTVTTPEEVRELFATVRAKYPAGSVLLMTVVPAADPWGSELMVGIDGDRGVLRYAGENSPLAGVYSKNPTATNADPVVYYFINADSEFPPNAEVSVAAVQAAVIDYLTTGEQPTSVEWQTVE